jgi:hypothetical protein
VNTKIAFISLVLFINACTKLERPEVDNESRSAQDAMLADQEFSGLVGPLFRHIMSTRLAVKQIKKFGVQPLKWESGDTITFQPAPVFSLDATALGGFNSDGKIRSGTIYLTLSKPFDEQGAVTNIQLQNYIADGISFSADSFTLVSIAESGNYYALDMGLKEGRCRSGDQMFSFTASRRLSIFYAGGTFGTSPYLTLYGTASGITRTGISYQCEVLKDVLKVNSCPCFTSGKVQLNPTGYKQKILEFGEGTCDDIGFFTVGENKVAFKLK